MRFKPRKKPDTFQLPLFLMDSLLYFFLSGLLIFFGPVFLQYFISYKIDGIEHIIDFNAFSLYETKNSTIVQFQKITVIISVIFLFSNIIYRLKKHYIYSFVIREDHLIVEKYNLLGAVKELKLNLNFINTTIKEETEDKDKTYELYRNGNKLPFFSSDTNKYWNIKNDNETLEDLFRAINNKIIIIKSTNTNRNKGLEMREGL